MVTKKTWFDSQYGIVTCKHTAIYLFGFIPLYHVKEELP
jgi:hypothetical protein